MKEQDPLSARRKVAGNDCSEGGRMGSAGSYDDEQTAGQCMCMTRDDLRARDTRPLGSLCPSPSVHSPASARHGSRGPGTLTLARHRTGHWADCRLQRPRPSDGRGGLRRLDQVVLRVTRFVDPRHRSARLRNRPTRRDEEVREILANAYR